MGPEVLSLLTLFEPIAKWAAILLGLFGLAWMSGRAAKNAGANLARRKDLENADAERQEFELNRQEQRRNDLEDFRRRRLEAEKLLGEGDHSARPHSAGPSRRVP